MSLLRTIRPLALLGLAAVPMIACSQSAEDVPEDDSSAIIGGTTSGPEDDAVVAIFRRGTPHCGGVVVAENVVVTALHCVTEIDQKGKAPMLGERLKSTELTIRIGAKPSAKAAATVSRIVVEDPVKLDAGPVPMSSNDVAILYVQPQDPAFSKIKPRKIGTRSLAKGDEVSVLGYGGQFQMDKVVNPLRQRLDGVEILAATGSREVLQSELDDGTQVNWTNKAREFTTETVACGADSGGPAFDSAGNLVGIISAVVGKCIVGSLSVFTDVVSHGDFIKKAIADVKNIGCLSDSQCGSATSGKICDPKTNKCMIGCRAGGTQCGAGKTCSAQGQSTGVVGICRTAGSTDDTTDPGYDLGPFTFSDIPGLGCPGINPLCPPAPGTSTQQRECKADADCNGQNGSKPRVCDIPMGRCLDGCRVATAGMCASGQACTAYAEDPLIGLCQVAQVPAQPTPPASPPSYQPEPTPQAAPDVTVGAGSADSDAGKKAKNKAKDAGGGCAVSSNGGSGTLAAPFGLGLALAALASRRRRKA